MIRALIPVLALSFVLAPARAAVANACAVRSPELKVARECYTGDMRAADEATGFVGVDESSPINLNYCFNALVVPYPIDGGRLSLLVLKDDAGGRAVARTYGVGVAALAASQGRVPTNKRAQVLRLAGLEAKCYAKPGRPNACSKGFFGYGGTDLPFALTLERTPAGFVVKSGVRNRAVIEAPGVPTAPWAPASAAPTLDFLAGQVRTRLVARARADLAKLIADPRMETADELTRSGPQFRYCRLAFDSLNARLNRPDPFGAAEHATFDELDRRLRDPVGQTTLATAPPPAPEATATAPTTSAGAAEPGPREPAHAGFSAP